MKTKFKYPSAIAASKSKITSLQRKILMCLINEAQNQVKSVTKKEYMFSIPIANIRKLSGATWMKTRDVEHHLRCLCKLAIDFNFLEKDETTWSYGVILAGFKHKPGDSMLEFCFPATHQDFILNPAMYHKLDLLIVSQLGIERSDAVYALLQDYIDAYKVPKISIDDFRELLGLPEGTYKRMDNLTSKILNPIVKEINTTTDIECNYKFIRSNYDKRRCVGIQWFVKYRDVTPQIPAPDVKEEKPKEEIKQDDVFVDGLDVTKLSENYEDLDRMFREQGLSNIERHNKIMRIRKRQDAINGFDVINDIVEN